MNRVNRRGGGRGRGRGVFPPPLPAAAAAVTAIASCRVVPTTLVLNRVKHINAAAAALFVSFPPRPSHARLHPIHPQAAGSRRQAAGGQSRRELTLTTVRERAGVLAPLPPLSSPLLRCVSAGWGGAGRGGAGPATDIDTSDDPRRICCSSAEQR